MNVISFTTKILDKFPMLLTYSKQELIDYFSKYSSENKIYNMRIYDEATDIVYSNCGNKEYYYSFHFYGRYQNELVVSYGKESCHRMNFSFYKGNISIRVFPHFLRKDEKLDVTFNIEELINLSEEELIFHIMSQEYNGFRDVFDEFLEGLKC